jgi:succinoglycan biosynthesis protein ExoO
MTAISIIMPAFNSRIFIDEAIQSVFQQNYENWELIVVDDGSSDGTGDLVRTQYRLEPRIKVICLEKNSGPGAARNAGLQVAQGEWVTVLDSDDKYVEDRLVTLLDICKTHSLDLVADNHYLLDDATNKIIQKGFMLPKDCVPLTPALLVQNDGPPFRFNFGFLQPFVNRLFLSQHNIIWPANLRVGEDFTFLFNILSHGAKAALIDKPLYIYTLPRGLNKTGSSKSRTNYGIGNIEVLIEGNKDLMDSIELREVRDDNVIRLLKVRHKRLLCAKALRDGAELLHHGRIVRSARRVFQEDWWPFFALDKARNLVQRCHVPRGIG